MSSLVLATFCKDRDCKSSPSGSAEIGIESGNLSPHRH
jgi:hypothetical protein